MDEGYNKDLRYLIITLNNFLNLNDFIIALTRKFQMESVNARLKKLIEFKNKLLGNSSINNLTYIAKLLKLELPNKLVKRNDIFISNNNFYLECSKIINSNVTPEQKQLL